MTLRVVWDWYYRLLTNVQVATLPGLNMRPGVASVKVAASTS